MPPTYRVDLKYKPTPTKQSRFRHPHNHPTGDPTLSILHPSSLLMTSTTVYPSHSSSVYVDLYHNNDSTYWSSHHQSSSSSSQPTQQDKSCSAKPSQRTTTSPHPQQQVPIPKSFAQSLREEEDRFLCLFPGAISPCGLGHSVYNCECEGYLLHWYRQLLNNPALEFLPTIDVDMSSFSSGSFSVPTSFHDLTNSLAASQHSELRPQVIAMANATQDADVVMIENDGQNWVESKADENVVYEHPTQHESVAFNYGSASLSESEVHSNLVSSQSLAQSTPSDVYLSQHEHYGTSYAASSPHDSEYNTPSPSVGYQSPPQVFQAPYSPYASQSPYASNDPEYHYEDGQPPLEQLTSGNWSMHVQTTAQRLLAPAPSYLPATSLEQHDTCLESSPSHAHAHAHTHSSIGSKARRQSAQASPSPHSHLHNSPSKHNSLRHATNWSHRHRRSPSPILQMNPGLHAKRSDKKPHLACLFCRGRKIACGPPPPGSKDKTCNQCQRRSLKCEYPSESRRGMRKKKAPALSLNLSASAPKVVIKTIKSETH